MKSLAEIKEIGYQDGKKTIWDNVFEQLQQVDYYGNPVEVEIDSDPGCDGWDGLLINAIGFDEVCDLFGLERGSDSNNSEEFTKACVAYCEGAQAGADSAVEAYLEKHQEEAA